MGSTWHLGGMIHRSWYEIAARAIFFASIAAMQPGCAPSIGHLIVHLLRRQAIIPCMYGRFLLISTHKSGVQGAKPLAGARGVLALFSPPRRVEGPTDKL